LNQVSPNGRRLQTFPAAVLQESGLGARQFVGRGMEILMTAGVEARIDAVLEDEKSRRFDSHVTGVVARA